MFPVWSRFRGGKGVATGGGIFAALSPVVFAILVASWFAHLAAHRKASLASIVIVILLPIGVGIVREEIWEVSRRSGSPRSVMVRHLGNVKRLVSRREHAISLTPLDQNRSRGAVA